MHPHDIWIIIPVMGMALGAFAIWAEFSRQRKALDVLRVYAEKGEEPPPTVVAVLTRASASDSRPQPPWPRFAFYTVMAVGFGLASAWFSQGDSRQVWVFVAGLGITSFIMAAYAASSLVTALTQPRADG
jgi:hypothetical protein